MIEKPQTLDDWRDLTKQFFGWGLSPQEADKIEDWANDWTT